MNEMTSNLKSCQTQEELVEVYFVYPISEGRKKLKRISKEDEEAFNFFDDNGIYPVRISEARLDDELISTKKNIFIVSSFTEDFVKNLSSAGRLVTTPLTVLYYKKYGTPFMILPHPYTSPCMKELIISTTGFKSDIRNKLFDAIRCMSGRPIERLTSKVNVLVCGNVLSEKYEHACARNIPVVSIEWVIGCQKIHQNQLKFADDEEILRLYRLKCFYNLKISITGIIGEERLQLQSKINAHDGKYIGNLDANVDVLISDLRKTEKSKFALGKNIPIVTKEWLHDCIKQNMRLPFSKYLVNFDDFSSGTVSSQDVITSSTRSGSRQSQLSKTQTDDQNKTISVDEWTKKYGFRFTAERKSTSKASQPDTNGFFNVTSSSDASAFNSSWERCETDFYIREKTKSQRNEVYRNDFSANDSSVSNVTSSSPSSVPVYNSLSRKAQDSLGFKPSSESSDQENEREISRSDSTDIDSAESLISENYSSSNAFTEEDPRFEGKVFLCGFSKKYARDLQKLVLQIGGTAQETSSQPVDFRNCNRSNCYLILKTPEIVSIPQCLLSAMVAGIMIVKESLITDYRLSIPKNPKMYQWYLSEEQSVQSKKLVNAIRFWKVTMEQLNVTQLFEGFHVVIFHNTNSVKKAKEILQNGGATIYESHEFEQMNNRDIFTKTNSFLLFDKKWVSNFLSTQLYESNIFKYFDKHSNILMPQFVEEFLLNTGSLNDLTHDPTFKKNQVILDDIRKSSSNKRLKSKY